MTPYLAPICSRVNKCPPSKPNLISMTVRSLSDNDPSIRAHSRRRSTASADSKTSEASESRGTARLPHQTTRRRHVSGTKGTFWAHLCLAASTLPLVADGENAGRPACFADGPTDHPGAPKGVRNLTCGFQEGSACFAECCIVAGHEAYAVSVGFTAAQPDSGCLQGVSCVQGTRMARTHAVEPTRNPGRFTSYDSARAGSSAAGGP